MQERTSKPTQIIIGIIFIIGVFILVPLSLVVFERLSSDYETTDIADYGNYVGVAEKYQTEYINSFFPVSIQPEFVDPVFAFHSRTIDTYGFEAYLEFTINDTTQFEEYVRSSTAEMREGVFHFDNRYQEYVLTNEETKYLYDSLFLSQESFTGEDGSTYYYIDYADISKILVNPEEQRIIYVSLAVFDGGGTDTELLHTFFDRFGIDPLDYQRYTHNLG